MILAIDYDKTITADPKGMMSVIRCFQSNGHKVVCVTMRHHEFDWCEDFKTLEDKYQVETIFCDGQAKRLVCAERGVFPDWWLDDWPEGIAVGSIYTPIELDEWRKAQQGEHKPVL